ncbi:hypothetical protein D9599_21915 [Roseomonas sp. KE2513]|uniref:hypothetical protein n=1 Tax=Roseomonas sp. KE2513 TaxID=2479202 RepID=UPI001E552227|nr:hypothetical protein [Roseomonas sp. KE2513]MBI0538225.1 hypothetical protein [Roseomonas sp. KE2513]
MNLEGKLGVALAAPDRQAHGIRDLEVADEAFANAFRAHFAGSSVLADRDKVRAATILRNSLKRGAERQLDAIIEMGRALMRAETVFTKQEWNHLLEGGPKLLGLPKNTASMYRAIARDIDAGRLPRALCPESFSTAYVLTTYEEDRLEAAKDRGLLRPTVTRREVEEFKRLPIEEVRVGGVPAAMKYEEGTPDPVRLRGEEQQLARRERKLLDELSRVQQRLSAVRETLGTISGVRQTRQKAAVISA